MTFQDETLAILVRGGDYVSRPSVGLWPSNSDWNFFRFS